MIEDGKCLKGARGGRGAVRLEPRDIQSPVYIVMGWWTDSCWAHCPDMCWCLCWGSNQQGVESGSIHQHNRHQNSIILPPVRGGGLLWCYRKPPMDGVSSHHFNPTQRLTVES